MHQEKRVVLCNPTTLGHDVLKLYENENLKGANVMPDINLIGTNKKRNITVTLPDEVSQKLLEKCAASGWDVNKLVENFIFDLTGNSRSGFRSAEKRANKWFEQSKPQKKQKKPTFLQWLTDKKLVERYMYSLWTLENLEDLRALLQRPSRVQMNYEYYDDVLSRMRENKIELNSFAVEYLKVNPLADMEIEIQAVADWTEQQKEFLEGVKVQEKDDSRNEPEDVLRKEFIARQPEMQESIKTGVVQMQVAEPPVKQTTEMDMKILVDSHDESYIDYMAPLLDEEKKGSPEEKPDIQEKPDAAMIQETPIVREQREDYLVLTVHEQQVSRPWDDEYSGLEIDACGDSVMIAMDEIEDFFVDLQEGIFWSESKGEYYKIKLPLLKKDGTENQIELYGEYDEQTRDFKKRMLSVQKVYDRASAQREKIAGLISEMDALGYELIDYGHIRFSTWAEKKDAKVDDKVSQLFFNSVEVSGYDCFFDGWKQVSDFVQKAHELQQTEELVLPRQRGRSR